MIFAPKNGLDFKGFTQFAWIEIDLFESAKSEGVHFQSLLEPFTPTAVCRLMWFTWGDNGAKWFTSTMELQPTNVPLPADCCAVRVEGQFEVTSMEQKLLSPPKHAKRYRWCEGLELNSKTKHKKGI